MLGLCCCVWVPSSCKEQGPLYVWRTGFSLWWLLLLQSPGSRVWALVIAVLRLSCPAACEILDQGSNPCLLHWQVDFYTGFSSLMVRMSTDQESRGVPWPELSGSESPESLVMSLHFLTTVSNPLSPFKRKKKNGTLKSLIKILRIIR